MPKKKPGMTPEEQSEAFKREVERLIDAGELSPADADTVLDDLVRRRVREDGTWPVNREGCE